MEKLEMLYEGKAKKVFKTEDENLYIVSYKDDATAFNGLKKGQITGKGVINNKMTNIIFKYLADNGIKTHLVEEINDRETIVKKVQIVPLEVIVRNVAAGSFSKRFGVEEGTALKNPIVEFSYKNDALGDPMINNMQATAIGIATEEEIDDLRKYLLSMGDSLVLVADDDVIKVHVHSNHPGLVIEKALSLGALNGLKIDNMRISTAVR